MKDRRWRQWAAVVLLAVYVPWVALTAVHVHHDTVEATDCCTECRDCGSHTGHFDKVHHHSGDCAVCRVMGQEYVMPEVPTGSPAPPAVDAVAEGCALRPDGEVPGIPRLRAPPVG